MANRFTVAWRSSLLPAKYFASARVGITVTGTPAMVAGDVATGTHMALEPVGVSGQKLVGFGSATNRNAWSYFGF